MDPFESSFDHTPTPIFDLRDNSRRSKIVITGLWIYIGFTVIALISGLFELDLLNRIMINGDYTIAEADANDLRQQILSFSQVGLYITVGILFMMWFRRAYGNVIRSGYTDTSFSETQAVWGWIIPFVNFVRPVKIMNEIWKGTQAKTKELNPNYEITETSMISAWWAIWIIGTMYDQAITRFFKGDDIETLINSGMAFIGSDTLNIIGAILAIVVVRKVTELETHFSDAVRNQHLWGRDQQEAAIPEEELPYTPDASYED